MKSDHKDFLIPRSRLIPPLLLENIPAKSLLRETSLDKLPLLITRVSSRIHTHRSYRNYDASHPIADSFEIRAKRRWTLREKCEKHDATSSIGSRCIRNQYSKIRTGLELVSFGFSVLAEAVWPVLREQHSVPEPFAWQIAAWTIMTSNDKEQKGKKISWPRLVFECVQARGKKHGKIHVAVAVRGVQRCCKCRQLAHLMLPR